jgi:hypothetical protein
MIYLRVFQKSGERIYQKVDARDYAEAVKVTKRKTKFYGKSELISRQEYEVGLLEMDIEQADAALAAEKEEPEKAGLPGLRTPYLRKVKKPTSAWPNIVMGIVSFICGIAMMIFWSTRDLDLRRSIIILVLCSVFLVMGLIFFVVGLLASRDT